MTDPRMDPRHPLYAASVAGDLSARLTVIGEIASTRLAPAFADTAASAAANAGAWAEVLRLCTQDREPYLQNAGAVPAAPPDLQQTAPRGATFARGSDCDGGVSNDG